VIGYIDAQFTTYILHELLSQILYTGHSVIGYIDGHCWPVHYILHELLLQVLSKEHSVIGHNEGVFYVRDLGSSNGTFVNGTRIRQAVIYLDITLEKQKQILPRL
jgi:hypothetical protein